MGLTGEEAKVLYDFIKFLMYLGLIVLIIRTIFRLLKWLYHAIWPARTQTRQRIKCHIFRKNPVKKQFKEKQWYPTGWYFDDETGLWTAPDYINNDPNNPMDVWREQRTQINKITAKPSGCLRGNAQAAA